MVMICGGPNRNEPSAKAVGSPMASVLARSIDEQTRLVPDRIVRKLRPTKVSITRIEHEVKDKNLGRDPRPPSVGAETAGTSCDLPLSGEIRVARRSRDLPTSRNHSPIDRRTTLMRHRRYFARTDPSVLVNAESPVDQPKRASGSDQPFRAISRSTASSLFECRG